MAMFDSVSNFSGSGLWAGRLAGWADRCCCCCCPIYTDGCVCNILQIRTGDNGDCLSPRLYIITSSGLQDIDERDTHTHPCMEWMDSVYSLHASLCVDSIFNRTTDEAYNSWRLIFSSFLLLLLLLLLASFFLYIRRKNVGLFRSCCVYYYFGDNWQA